MKQHETAFSQLIEEFDRGLETIAAKDIGTSVIANAAADAEIDTLKAELTRIEAFSEAKASYLEQQKQQL